MVQERIELGGNGGPERQVWIPIETGELAGSLVVPEGAEGIVLFAHGAGSSRFSPRNRYVADVLQKAGLATLLFDLLLEEEAENRANVFDIDLLARRLMEATSFLLESPETGSLAVGYFGASTGAAAALVAAAELPEAVGAVVSRGGRPDLAMEQLPRVRAPTLLIVGGLDEPVIEMNREALERLEVEKDLVIVPGATHLFEEPGTLEQVAVLASDWFVRHLTGRARVRRAA